MLDSMPAFGFLEHLDDLLLRVQVGFGEYELEDGQQFLGFVRGGFSADEYLGEHVIAPVYHAVLHAFGPHRPCGQRSSYSTGMHPDSSGKINVRVLTRSGLRHNSGKE